MKKVMVRFTAVTEGLHKIIQILVNLIGNVHDACRESSVPEKRITLGTVTNGEFVRITVSDNRVGVPPENLVPIFSSGFTTKKNGHGFGLHSGAIAAKQMGGSLSVRSDGPGLGAVFTLEIPVQHQN
jgi:C4-dicarboxylate-specific signal transduction histidine kinase